MIDDRRRCERCGKMFRTDSGRTWCMKCLCEQHNKPAGQRQAEPDPSPDGNPDHILNTDMDPDPPEKRDFETRLAEGNALMGLPGEDIHSAEAAR